MKEKYKKKKEKLLQKVADFICVMLELSSDNQKQFDFWMWKGLSLDYYCVEKGIYLN